MRGEHTWFEKITYHEAEKIAGISLDRRRQYYKHTEEGKKIENIFAFNGFENSPNARLFTFSEWTEECSGCSEYLEGVCLYSGGGCHECGYTGKKIQSMHIPFIKEEEI